MFQNRVVLAVLKIYIIRLMLNGFRHLILAFSKKKFRQSCQTGKGRRGGFSKGGNTNERELSIYLVVD
jgi:hypothetical protein